MSKWLMPYNNEQRNPLSECILVPPLKPLWKRRFKHPMIFPLCVDQDRILLTAEDSDCTYGIDTLKNTVLWKTRFGGRPELTKIDRRLFVSSNPSLIVDSETGEIIHRFNFDGGQLCVFHDNYLYANPIMHDDREIKVIKINLADYNYDILFHEPAICPGPIAFYRDCIVFPITKRRLIRVGVTDGKVFWIISEATEFNPDPIGAVTIDGGLIYHNTVKGLRILNFETGKDVHFVPYKRTGAPAGPVCVDVDAIYVANNYTIRIDKKTYNVDWTFRHRTNWSNGPIIVSGDLVYFGTTGGFLLALDKRTGQIVWQFDTGGHGYIQICLAIADNKLFVGNSVGNFYCLVEDR